MYVKTSGKPVFDANGEFRGYRGTGTDVTAIMRTQEALRESERSLRSAIDGIPGLVAVLAPNGEVESVNRQLLEYFGQPLEWLKNWGTNDAVHPEDLPRVVEVFSRAVASGLPFQIDQRQRCIDGEYRWFETRGVPIRDDSGRIARWYVLLTDIEDRTRALAQLEQMQSDFAHMNRVSMMGELAASLSHEITQPIASARNNARAAQNFLDMQPPDLSEVREALSCVVCDTDRAGDIVDRIRDHIKKTPPRKERFDLNEAINEIIVLGRSAIIKNGVSLQTRLSEGLFPVHCDRVQLQQVVLNLILNAAEAMGSEAMGSVEAEATRAIDQHGSTPHGCSRGSARFRARYGSGNALLRRFTPRRPTVSGRGYRFAGPSSTPMGAGYGQSRMSHAAPYFSSPCLPCRWDLEFGAKRSVAGKQHLVRTRCASQAERALLALFPICAVSRTAASARSRECLLRRRRLSRIRPR
jgi:PAS domain S-box-containing protein